MRILSGLAALAAVAVFASFGATGGVKDGKVEVKGKVDIRGTIKSAKINKAGEKILAVILIEGERTKDTSYDKASVKITKATKLVRVGAKDRRAATVEDLKTGNRVEAIFTGPVAESYPVQATAGEVRIIVAEK
jgi:beta-N-acetylhexosaminidase